MIRGWLMLVFRKRLQLILLLTRVGLNKYHISDSHFLLLQRVVKLGGQPEGFHSLDRFECQHYGADAFACRQAASQKRPREVPLSILSCFKAPIQENKSRQ